MQQQKGTGYVFLIVACPLIVPMLTLINLLRQNFSLTGRKLPAEYRGHEITGHILYPY
jgi:hypothetical protein